MGHPDPRAAEPADDPGALLILSAYGDLIN